MNARPKIKPIVDVPIVLQMESVIGQESKSPYTGIEYRYSVVHEHQPSFIYLPPEGRDAIVRARPQVGDLVELLMQKRGREQYFRAQILSDGYEQPEYDERQPQPAGAGPRLAPAMNGRSHRHAPTQPAPAPYGRERQVQAPAPAPALAPVAQSYPIEELLVRCYQAAARAVKAGIVAAEEAGAPTDATFEDISKTAISLFIDRRKGGN
jgi:hypothetical protein